MFKKSLLAAASLIAFAAPALAERATLTLEDITRPIVPIELLAGDREFGGNGPFMVLETQLVPIRGGTEIQAWITFRAEETGGDGSFTRIGPVARTVWRSEHGERVEHIVGHAGARMEWNSTPGASPFQATGGGMEDGGLIVTMNGQNYIRNITYLGDTSGDDISTDSNPHGDTSIRAIRFHPITVELVD